jgi:uncharacterized protein YeaO (DUF488 family)
MLKIFTSRIGYKGNKRVLDITVKSGDKTFAPTWDMVMGLKRGKLSWSEYERLYHERMRKSWVENRARWKEVLSWDEVVLVCYCRDLRFCHRRLLKNYLVACGAIDGGEI